MSAYSPSPNTALVIAVRIDEAELIALARERWNEDTASNRTDNAPAPLTAPQVDAMIDLIASVSPLLDGQAERCRRSDIYASGVYLGSLRLREQMRAIYEKQDARRAYEASLTADEYYVQVLGGERTSLPRRGREDERAAAKAMADRMRAAFTRDDSEGDDDGE